MPKKFDFISPGIQLTEVDQSILPAEVDADGPIVIGRFRKGPGMKPVKVKSLEDFVQVFGTPVPGGSSLQGDVWRDGANLSAPTYAAYAAQAWLASETSPVTVVRLMGDQHPNPGSNAGRAGWMLNTSIPTTERTTNSTAYGLFVIDESKVAKGNTGTITLASSGTNNYDAITFTIGSTVFEFVNTKVNSATADPAHIAITYDSDVVTTLNDLAILAAAVVGQKITDGTLDINVDQDGAILTITNRDTSSLALAKSSADITISGASIAAAGQAPTGNGTLAAVFYCDSGYLVLEGQKAGTSATVVSASCLIKSTATNEFKLNIYKTTDIDATPSSTVVESITFNFDQNSNKYIRNRFNTTPYKVNSSVLKNASDAKSYWLGETFDRSLKDTVTSTGAGNQLGILLPLHVSNEGTAVGNWGYNKAAAAYSKTGYFIDYNKSSYSAFKAQEQQKLFRLCSLHEGAQIQKEIMITIEDLKTPVNPLAYNYGSFTLKVISVDGTVLESYTNLTFDPNSPNYVSRRIGDMYMLWNEKDRKYKSYGEFENQSDYIRVELHDKRLDMKGMLPVGFLGPGRPRGFELLAGATQPQKFDGSGDFAGAFVSGTVPQGSNAGNMADLGTGINVASFKFPSLPLRQSGSDGFSANPYRVHFGIRPKIAQNSTVHDYGYCDYVKALPTNYASSQFSPSGDFEYSFVFSLDDIRVNEGNVVTWESGSHTAGESFTAVSGTIQPLFDLGVKQFVAPLFGGFDGLDVTQIEPFANDQIGDTLAEQTNYRQYTINKAIDSVSDSELVPANLLIAPGLKKSLVTNRLINLAETRKDMLAIVDLEGDYTSVYESTNSEENRLGTVDSAVSNLKNLSIDSSYAATYYPAVQIQDNINSGERVWVPSSVAGFGALAQSERNSELWFAPAGFNRGGLGNLGGPSGPPVIQARQRLDSRDRDKLYEVGINPIATFPNEGVVIFGQKTLQQTPSALDRINVRRLMIFIKAEIGKVARNLLFEPGVQATFNRFKSQAEPILASIQNRFGLTDFRVVLDETTTTPDLIDRNIMYAKIFLKPARAIEFIAVDFVITNSGAEFV
tara:strand:+ start:111 stop:3338 length:3228 start_codon:yes stop_codon:yes gene_type:complete